MYVIACTSPLPVLNRAPFFPQFNLQPVDPEMERKVTLVQAKQRQRIAQRQVAEMRKERQQLMDMQAAEAEAAQVGCDCIQQTSLVRRYCFLRV